MNHLTGWLVEYSIISTVPLVFCLLRLRWAQKRRSDLERRLFSTTPTHVAVAWFVGGSVGIGACSLSTGSLSDATSYSVATSLMGVLCGWTSGYLSMQRKLRDAESSEHLDYQENSSWSPRDGPNED